MSFDLAEKRKPILEQNEAQDFKEVKKSNINEAETSTQP
jgi:hypothetical protein